MQSPIDMRTVDVYDDPELSINKLQWNYEPNLCKILSNTGHGWKVAAHGNDSSLTGGPLANTYRLLQIHGHWGRGPTSGSEHTIDGVAYAGELHFVHWNIDSYIDPRVAAVSPKGLAVIAVFMKEDKKNGELTKVTDMLAKVYKVNDEYTLTKGINPISLFPDNKDYWTYEGSLTTPDFNESVTWIIFKNPIEISRNQLEAFRSMNGSTDESDGARSVKKVYENRRSIQDINGRIVRASPIPKLS